MHNIVLVKYMVNALKYFYDLDIKKLIKNNNNFYFKANNNSYLFTELDRTNEELDELYKLSIFLFNNGILCHQFILNISNQIISIVDNKKYILMQIYRDVDDYVTINDIISFSKKTKSYWNIQNLKRNNWSNLWMYKIDNLDYQIHNLKKNSLEFFHNFFYFEGIVENCIQLFNEIYEPNYDLLCIAHKRVTVNTTYKEFYNPNFLTYKVHPL